MKNHVLKSLMGLAVIAFTFSGCDLVDKADDVTFDIELTHTFVIDETFDSEGEPVDYADADSWDPKEEPEFDKYKDKIKEIIVNSVSYTVTDYQAEGDVTFSDGVGSFKATTNSATALASARLPIQNVATSVGGEFTLDYTVDQLNAIAEHLESIEPIFFQVSGTFSETPVTFKVPVTIHCTIKANALD